jgi:hypothetical protein
MFQNGAQIDYQPALITDSNNNIISYQQICITTNVSYSDDQTSSQTKNKKNSIISDNNFEASSANEEFLLKGLFNKGNLIMKNNVKNSE